MAPAGIVEPVDVLEDRSFRLPSCRPFLPPDHFGLQRFEECLDGRVVIAIALAAHRWPQAISLKLLLIGILDRLEAGITLYRAKRDAPLGRRERTMWQRRAARRG